MTCTDIFLGLIAILFPPIAVWVKRGICTADSLINIALCVLGYLPGLLHAWYIIARYPDAVDGYEALGQDPEGRGQGGGRVTYYYVDHRGHVGGPGGVRGYGATDQTAGPAGGERQAQGEGEGGVPPTYAQAVKGDHKVQTSE